jgi:tRNA threonylcarbamoyladenosine biosynthesis protein TsaB
LKGSFNNRSPADFLWIFLGSMRILAIETVDRSGSVAVLDDGQVKAAADLDPSMRSAQSLAPAIDELCKTAEWQPREIHLVAVAIGPGSFTGLRVGVTTAKLFAYAAGAAVIGVNTLEAIAWQVPRISGELWAVMNAEREQFVAALFIRDAATDRWKMMGEPRLMDMADWVQRVSPGQSVSGPGLEKLRGPLPAGMIVVEQNLWPPKAVAVGQIGWRDFQAGKRDDIFALLPQYYRRSAAEEKFSPPASA